MRLTCPNCAAEYEVAAALVPPDGRHVQCTACHTRWFARPVVEPAPASVEDEDAILRRLEARPRLVSPVAPVVVPLSPPAGPAPAAAEPGPAEADTPKEPDAGGPEAQDTAQQDVPELATPEQAAADPRVPDDVQDAEEVPEAEEPRELRPALVPATGEPRIVNLPAPSGRARLDLTVEPRPAPMTLLPSSRFGHGLVLALVVVALAAAAYLWRAPIAAQVPAAAPGLAAYSDLVDDLREALAGAFSGG